MGKKLNQVVQTLRSYIRSGYKKLVRIIESRPLPSFFVVLLMLFILIVISNIISRPKVATKPQTAEPKKVSIYKIGTAPTVTLQAQVEKTGVITITALTPGIVQQINIAEGQQVGRGANLIWLSNNYQGDSLAALQTEMAGRQYQTAHDTYPIQKDLIARQRDLAIKNKSNIDELRDITSKSVDETESLINLNVEILNNMDSNIANLENNNSNGSNDALILSTKQMKAQMLAGLNQTLTALRQAQYQADSDNPPTKLAELQRDITFEQLDLQDKTLDVGLEVSRIQYQMALVSEGMMHPVAPVSGTIQKVHVRLGQAVNPGTVLVTIAGNVGELKAVVYAPVEIAGNISKLEPSSLFIGDQKISLTPTFISQEAVQGNLYSITYAIPGEFHTVLTDKSYIRTVIPIGYPDTAESIPFIPMDSVYQSKDKAYVFVEKSGRVESKTVNLGAVYGEFVEVNSGLAGGDKVITDRNVIEGDGVVED